MIWCQWQTVNFDTAGTAVHSRALGLVSRETMGIKKLDAMSYLRCVPTLRASVIQPFDTSAGQNVNIQCLCFVMSLPEVVHSSSPSAPVLLIND